MKLRITSIVLLMVYLTIWLKPLFPYIEFELNKTYIIKTLCAERDKEVNTCQGQCHLDKEIEKNSNQEEEKQNRVPEQNFDNEIFFIILSGHNSPLHETIKNTCCIYLNNYRYLINRDHFHPPEVA